MKGSALLITVMVLVITFVFAVAYVPLNDVVENTYLGIWKNETDTDYHISSSTSEIVRLGWKAMPAMVIFACLLYIYINSQRRIYA